MKYILTLGLFAALAFFVWTQFSPTLLQKQETQQTFSGQVVGIIDGDSIKVRFNNDTRRVELAGIDAPEIGQAFGDISTGYLADLIDGREVEVKVIDTNEFGEVIGEVILADLSINQLMLTDGYAWARRGFFEDRKWAGLESLARNRGFGLWRNGEPMSPWEFRELEKKS